MQTIFLFSFFSVCYGYFDFSILKVDTRVNNSKGEVNPFVLFGVTLNALNGVSYRLSNAEAWNKWATSVEQAYGLQTAGKIENLTGIVFDTLEMIPLMYQSFMVGGLQETWESLTGTRRSMSPATQQGQMILQSMMYQFQSVIYPGFQSMFYNPFDTDMLNTLNETQVQEVNVNLFQMMGAPYYYYYK